MIEFGRYLKFREKHPSMKAVEKITAVGVLLAAANVGRQGRTAHKPEVPIVKAPPEGDLAYWLGIPYENDGYAKVRNDLTYLEELGATVYLRRRVRTGRKWLSFSANLPHPIATTAAIRKKLSLPKPPKAIR